MEILIAFCYKTYVINEIFIPSAILALMCLNLSKQKKWFLNLMYFVVVV